MVEVRFFGRRPTPREVEELGFKKVFEMRETRIVSPLTKKREFAVFGEKK